MAKRNRADLVLWTTGTDLETTRMSRRFRQLLPFALYFGLPYLGLAIDGSFGFPLTRAVFADAIDYVVLRIGLSTWPACLAVLPGPVTLGTLVFINWRRSAKRRREVVKP
jgi:hypothetical protein